MITRRDAVQSASQPDRCQVELLAPEFGLDCSQELSVRQVDQVLQ
jgi:hypothetical protein